jgi:hypothetical protein
MTDVYPEAIVHLGLADAWKTAPVTMEVCWVMQYWKDKGWNPDYIMDQAIKWHISSFNAKSSPVPAHWKPLVDRWLNRMGYRFVLRRFTYNSAVDSSRKLQFTSWWENKGDAPAYRSYRLALRLRHGDTSRVLVTDADIRSWLPGDSLFDDSVFIPADLPDGAYNLDLALLDPAADQPKIKLAISGIEPDGWYPLGTIQLHTHAN